MSVPGVLIIDDDESIYEIVDLALSSIDISCMFAISAETGIELAQQYQPRLILMDLLLPDGMNGWEAIKILKSKPETQHIPIIAFTASTGHYIRQAMQAGAEEFIVKPFSIGQFQRTISKYVAATHQ